IRKSCTRTASGDPLGRHARPPFLKSPTSSFFLASTEITGSPAASAVLTLASMKANWVDSSGRRNTAYVSCSEELVQSLGRCPPAQGLSRPAVEGDRHGRKIVRAVRAEVGALWKVLAQQPVGVLVRATLPGAVGIAEVDRHASLHP